MKKILFVFILMMILIVSKSFSNNTRIAGNGKGQYLLLLNQTVSTETKELYNLNENEYVSFSESGNYFSVLSHIRQNEGFINSYRIIDRNNIQKYEVESSKDGVCFVSDNGASIILIFHNNDMVGATFTIYDPDGKQITSFERKRPGKCIFLPEDKRVAITVPGDKTYVHDLQTGEEIYNIPYSKHIYGLNSQNIILLERDWIALYSEAKKIWSRPHNLYYPRLIKKSNDGTNILIGAHHELALFNLDKGEKAALWTAPEKFGITSLDAASDLSLVAIGIRSLDGRESSILLDRDFKVLDEKIANVEKPSGLMPIVFIPDHDKQEVLVFGQNWNAVLGVSNEIKE